jgi:hypothetical protein
MVAHDNLRSGDVVLVYAKRSGRVRRWWVVDGDKHSHPVHENEEAIVIPRHKKGNLHVLQRHATEHSGNTPPHDGRHVVIDTATSKIVNAVRCDPECGDTAPPGCELVQHDTADTNWTVQMIDGNWSFTAPAEENGPKAVPIT